MSRLSANTTNKSPVPITPWIIASSIPMGFAQGIVNVKRMIDLAVLADHCLVYRKLKMQ